MLYFPNVKVGSDLPELLTDFRILLDPRIYEAAGKNYALPRKLFIVNTRLAQSDF